MAQMKRICGCCGNTVLVDAHDAIAQYACGHVEHEDCYFHHHPHNLTCLVCGVESELIYFK